MKGLRRSKWPLNHELPGDNSQENKGEALHALADDDDDNEEGEDVNSDRARLRESATEGIFSLTDLKHLALKPGLTTKELANGFWNLQGRLEEVPNDPERQEPADTFVINIILGRNLEVFLEVNKSLSFGKGMILQLIFAAVRVGDEDAVVRLVSLLHKRRYNKLFDAFEEALNIQLTDEVPHSGARGLVKQIVRLKIVKPGNKAVTKTYSCKDFIENFSVLRCSKQALIAIDEVLGPQVWDEVKRDKAIAADIDQLYYAERRAHNGVLEYLLRHNALMLTTKLCAHISRYVGAPPLSKDSPHIQSLVDYYIEAGFPFPEAADNKRNDLVSLIYDDVLYGRVNRLHSLLELCVPAESSCTVREDGLLNEPRPPQHIVEKRAKMVFDRICKQGNWYQKTSTHAGLPLQHYIFHELQLDIEQLSKYCKFRVIYLGPTSPPALVDKVLQIVQTNVPKLDIDKWKDLFKQDVYPVPAYYGDQDREGVGSSVADKMDKYRKSLGYYRTNSTTRDTYVAYEIKSTMDQTHETLEYLRPWFRVFSSVLGEETKFSMDEAMELCSRSDFRAQVMLEADMIRISDELRDEWCQKKRKLGFVYLPHLSNNLFPLYLKWYEYTKDRELMQVLQVVLFATACATNRISEAKRVLLDMLQPPSGQDPCAKVSSRRVYLLTMAACTRNLPFVKWVFSQMQAAFPLEPSEKLKDLGDVSGSSRTNIEWHHHQLTIPAWQDFMTNLIPVDRFHRFHVQCPETKLYDPFAYLTNHVLHPPCPKYVLETGLLLAQMDPLAVLPLIFRIIIMKQQSMTVWNGGYRVYDSPAEIRNVHDYDDDDDDDDDDDGDDDDDDDDDNNKEEEKGRYGTNPAWAWGPITLVKLIELIADETTGTADTILNAKEQTKRIGVEGSRAFSLTRSGGIDSGGPWRRRW